MNKKLLAIFCTMPLFTLLHSQNIKDSSILVSASHNVALNQITLNWTTTDATSFYIHRKPLNTIVWDTATVLLPGTANSYVDTKVQKGTVYEYRILKIKGNVVRALAYVAAGMEIPLNNYKKNIYILVDNATYSGIDTSYWNQLKNDYYMDGYGVYFSEISESATPDQVKNIIKSWYHLDTSVNTQCILIGRIPVAYTGSMLAATVDLPPDAHPDHGGAWPSDSYYGEMHGNWTDVGTMTANVTRPANMNTPGDGKFDQHFLPSDMDIQIGRIDFRLLPSQGLTDIEMCRNYLIKLHNYKSAKVKVPEKAFISDNFGYLGSEMPMRSGWNNASALVGKSNITASGNYFDSSKANSYLFANYMGAGSFSTCGGVGSSAQFKDSIRSVFNVSFGSYFGDWYTQDNFLRSCLASKGLTLTNVWAHRPHWYFHHMALGMQVGYSVIKAQNNLSDFSFLTGYIGSFGGSYLDRRISMNLMGDPTLRIKYIDGPDNVNAGKINNNTDVQLIWDASSEPGILGYNIYRTNKKGGLYYAINNTPVTSFNFTDTNPYFGTNYYIVKAVKLEKSNCGSYFNSSLGVMVTIHDVQGSNTALHQETKISFKLYPNPAGARFTVEGADNGKLSVFDINGKIVFETNNTHYSFQINTESWTRGIYLLRYVSGNKSHTEKLILQ